MGFFTDAYDLFCISLVTKLLGRIYYHVDGSSKPGIGGDYPLSATIMSEYANKKTRGAFIAAVFAMQGFGILGGGIFAIIISAVFQACFKAPAYQVDPLGSTVPQADYVWRIILMVGHFLLFSLTTGGTRPRLMQGILLELGLGIHLLSLA
ncbi:hypothetical protein MTR67_040289 [Solanum verrucosum]|uniref:Major facilitator superfamily (MFS) profile domain-containing protein n=1 Tax=Solanum verrucosum TaxID=315347 RepID=A0AAF0UKI5_SOLVR|nr:hypothetical protein MTR67_040289 [Solanum verrucosum]